MNFNSNAIIKRINHFTLTSKIKSVSNYVRMQVEMFKRRNKTIPPKIYFFYYA